MWPAGIEAPSNATLSLYQLTGHSPTGHVSFSMVPHCGTSFPSLRCWWRDVLWAPSVTALHFRLLYLGGDTLGWKIQWPLETCLRDSSSIPVHSYKSSFLDESVVMAEPSAALGEGRGGFSLLRNLWTVGQHSESWNSFWSSQPLGLYYRLESSKSLLVTVVAHSLRN